MKLSIVGIFHNMVREAARTLLSLSPSYQTGLVSEDYEVIAIDNGRTQPLLASAVEGMGANFRYRFYNTDAVSPAAAVKQDRMIRGGEDIQNPLRNILGQEVVDHGMGPWRRRRVMPCRPVLAFDCNTPLVSPGR